MSKTHKEGWKGKGKEKGELPAICVCSERERESTYSHPNTCHGLGSPHSSPPFKTRIPFLHGPSFFQKEEMLASSPMFQPRKAIAMIYSPVLHP